VNEFCISQGSGGQVHNHLCQISLGFRVPEIIKIVYFTELFKK